MKKVKEITREDRFEISQAYKRNLPFYTTASQIDEYISILSELYLYSENQIREILGIPCVYFDEEKIISLYSEGYVPLEISRITGMNYSEVKRFCYRNGMKGNKKKSSLERNEQEFIKLYTSGAKRSFIADKFGVSETSVSQYAFKIGVHRSHATVI